MLGLRASLVSDIYDTGPHYCSMARRHHVEAGVDQRHDAGSNGFRYLREFLSII